MNSEWSLLAIEKSFPHSRNEYFAKMGAHTKMGFRRRASKAHLQDAGDDSAKI